VQADLVTLASDGAQQPGQAQLAVSQAHAAIRDAIKTANTHIDQANVDDAAAYPASNAIATGSCQGGGPVGPPEAAGHIH
jgi:hypothetical protein